MTVQRVDHTCDGRRVVAAKNILHVVILVKRLAKNKRTRPLDLTHHRHSVSEANPSHNSC